MRAIIGFVVLLQGLLCVLTEEVRNPVQEIYRRHGPTSRLTAQGAGNVHLDAGKIHGIKFLISVNDTWGNCFATVRTPILRPKVPYNESVSIKVGSCDNGPLTYTIAPAKGGNVTVFLTFYSSVIEDASHPACSIKFAGKFLNPTTLGDDHFGRLPSVLPGCSLADSREGYHMTYYWFYIYDWFTAP